MPGWLNRVVEQTSVGTEFDMMNMKEVEAFYRDYGVGYDGPDVKFPNGYDQIFSQLEGDYQVRLSSLVQTISYSVAGVRLGVAGEPEIQYDAALVTVPLGVLKQGTIAFDPPLSDERQAAIDHMGMGVLDKLYLLFDAPFWDQDKTTILTPETGLPRGQFNYWINFQKYLDVPIIMAFNAGAAARALSGETDEDMVNRALDTLRQAYR